jgi:hypothetical protein
VKGEERRAISRVIHDTLDDQQLAEAGK